MALSTKVSDQTRSAISAKAVTATTTFDSLTRAIYVGTGGDLSVVFEDAVSVVLKGAAAGYHPLQVKQVNGTGTTATGIVALF